VLVVNPLLVLLSTNFVALVALPTIVAVIVDGNNNSYAVCPVVYVPSTKVLVAELCALLASEILK